MQGPNAPSPHPRVQVLYPLSYLPTSQLMQKKICAARVLRTELKDLPIPLSQEVVIFLRPYGVRGRVILLELRVAEETVAGLGPSPGSLPTPSPPPIYACGRDGKSLLVCGPHSGSALTAYSCNDGVEERSNFGTMGGWGHSTLPRSLNFLSAGASLLTAILQAVWSPSLHSKRLV